MSNWCTDLSWMQNQESSGMNESIFRRTRKIIATTESARNWFFGLKLTQDKNSRGKLLARTLTKVPNDDFRRATSKFVRTVSLGLHCKTCDDVDDGFGNFIASCREYTFSGNRDSEAMALWRNATCSSATRTVYKCVHFVTRLFRVHAPHLTQGFRTYWFRGCLHDDMTCSFVAAICRDCSWEVLDKILCFTFGCPIVVQTPRGCSVQACDLDRKSVERCNPVISRLLCLLCSVMLWNKFPFCRCSYQPQCRCPHVPGPITASCACDNAVLPTNSLLHLRCIWPISGTILRPAVTDPQPVTLTPSGTVSWRPLQPWLHIQTIARVEFCGRCESVHGVLTLCNGTAQDFNDNCVVELKEQLEVEEEDGDRQEKEEEKESGEAN